MTMIGLPKTELDTPALWVDLDRLDHNIAALARHFREAGVGWRPHTKGIKTPAIAHKLVAAGALGVTCAKLAEAEVMVAAGITDVLIANEVTGRHKLPRLANLCRQADVKVAVDNAANVAALEAAAIQYGAEIGVVVEVNTGMERAGALPGQPTVDLARLAHETPGVRFRGLMTWEGHAVAMDDAGEKRRAIERSIGLLLDSAALCRRAGLPVAIVSGGGSGTYTVTPFLQGMTGIQAGGAIFCDATYLRWGVDLQPALFVQATVTSRPTPTRVIYDAGYKALPAFFGAPVPLGLDEPVERVVCSAEHGNLTLGAANATLGVGDTLDFLVGYGDATVYLYDVLYGVRDGMVETAWPVLGRGRLT